ncbi:MAG: hypothetical protein JST22_20100 [Bacteroidetes bacterium]|nr:hypothetical protein [Bacteroidota bacterium]
MNSPISRMCPFRLLLLALVVPALGLHSVYAQDTYAERATIVTKLNTKLGLLRAPGATGPEVLNSADIGNLNLRGVFGSCLTVSDDPIITLGLNPGTTPTVTMRIVTGPSGGRMQIPLNSHRMVCDLEDAWLRRSWGLTFNDVIGDPVTGYVIGSGSPCLVSGHFQQAYFMDVLSNISGGSVAQRTRDSIWDRVAEWSIHHNSYTVDQDATLAKLVLSGLAIFPRVDASMFPGEDNLPFIVQRETGLTRDIGHAKLAYAKVIFRKEQLANLDSVVKSVEIEARIRQYPPTFCGVQSSPGILAPDPDSAYVRITFWIRIHPSDADSTPFYVWKKFATSSPAQDNIDLWSFFSSDAQWQLDKMCEFNIDTDGYLYFEAKEESAHHLGTTTGKYRIMRLRFPDIPATYCDYTFNLANEFALDAMTGTIYTTPVGSTDPTQYETVPCLDFCKLLSGYRTMTNVIAASAQRFGNTWPYDTSEFLENRVLPSVPNFSNNVYELGQGTWRPMEAYAYRTGTKPGGKLSNSSERVYDDAGVFVNDDGTRANAFRLFDWRNPDANTGTKWLLASTVTLFSPFGEPLEERDILGIYSAARFAHRNTMPKLVAKNARYTSVGYESFEDGKGDANTFAHSGQWCLTLPHGGSTDKEVMKLTVTDQMRTQNVLVRFWAKRTYASYSDLDLPVKITGALSTATSTGAMTKIAQTGEWTLFEQVCDVSATSTGDVISLTVNNNLSTDDVWLDDVRAQPFDAEMICYAYDPATLRLVAQFDDQHFGAFYQYNGEGKLVRTLRETERGIKTVAETQYHTPDMTNYDGTPGSRTQLGGGAALGMAAMRNPEGDAGGDGEDGRKKMGGNFSLFDMNAGPDGLNWSLLGGRKPDLSRLDPDSLRAMIAIDTTALSTAQLDRLHAAGLGDVEKLKDLIEVRELERRITALTSQNMDSLNTEERTKAKAELADLQQRRRALMKERLGVDEDGLRQMYKSLKDAETEPDAKGSEQ